MRVDQGLFTPLEPPRGGAERFRQRLEAMQRPTGRWRALLVTSSVLVLIAAAFLMLVDTEPESGADPPVEPLATLHDARQLDRLLGRPLEKSDPVITINERTAAVAELRSENEKVRIYRIE